MTTSTKMRLSEELDKLLLGLLIIACNIVLSLTSLVIILPLLLPINTVIAALVASFGILMAGVACVQAVAFVKHTGRFLYHSIQALNRTTWPHVHYKPPSFYKRLYGKISP